MSRGGFDNPWAGKRNGFDFLAGRAGKKRSGSGGGGFDFLSGRAGKRNSRKVSRESGSESNFDGLVILSVDHLV